MQENNKASAFILGAFLAFGLIVSGYLLGNTAIKFKEYERTVKVKGLSEQEHKADIVIWPIQFTMANNNLEQLYSSIETSSDLINYFLGKNGITPAEITSSIPTITDKSAQGYGNNDRAEFRYAAVQTITVYSKNIDIVQRIMGNLSELGKKGIVFTADTYESPIEYIFTRLNHVKPEMVEEATRKARQIALKFAADSKSKLGKIKRASQGQFSIKPRDKNNPHIKKVRVVSTVEYYLSD
jgi:hypothetical protein